MSQEITVNAGGKVNQTITVAEIKKEPPSISVGPVTVAHDDIWISAGIIGIIAVCVLLIKYCNFWKKQLWLKKQNWEVGNALKNQLVN